LPSVPAGDPCCAHDRARIAHDDVLEGPVEAELSPSSGPGAVVGAISFSVSDWRIELEPEVSDCIEALPAASFAIVAFHVDRLAQRGPELRMPHSRSLREGLFELRFDLERVARRITYFLPGDGRIVLLTVFRKQRDNERREIDRARIARRRCIDEGHRVEDDDEP
jgi:phage-related protein